MSYIPLALPENINSRIVRHRYELGLSIANAFNCYQCFSIVANAFSDSNAFSYSNAFNYRMSLNMSLDVFQLSNMSLNLNLS